MFSDLVFFVYFVQMNTYLQAAVHNLKAVRAEKAIAECDRYLETSAANFEQFRKVEAELVAEQEKVRTLEAELVRVRTEAVEDFKKSQEYEDLLVAEYDASFPETFKSCWVKIIEELGSQIEGVTLERFPVPDLQGKKISSPMEVENLGDSHPVDSQDGEIPTEFLEVEEPDETGANLGEKAQGVEAQDETPLEEAQDAAQLQGKEQEDVFDDGLP